jgi:hypothetical protein
MLHYYERQYKSTMIAFCEVRMCKCPRKKRSLTRVEALSGGLLPRFGGAHTVSVQIASRVVNEVENRCGGGAQQAEQLCRRGGAVWRDGFYRQPGRKGNMHRLGLERSLIVANTLFRKSLSSSNF